MKKIYITKFTRCRELNFTTKFGIIPSSFISRRSRLKKQTQHLFDHCAMPCFASNMYAKFRHHHLANYKHRECEIEKNTKSQTLEFSTHLFVNFLFHYSTFFFLFTLKGFFCVVSLPFYKTKYFTYKIETEEDYIGDRVNHRKLRKFEMKSISCSKLEINSNST